MVDTERVATMDFGVECDGKIDSRVLETMTTESNTVRRRTLLATTGAGAAALLAGCSGQSSETDDSSNNGNQTQTDQKNEQDKTETDEPEQRNLSGQQWHDRLVRRGNVQARLNNLDIDWEHARGLLGAHQEPTKGLAAAAEVISEGYGAQSDYNERHSAVVVGLQKLVDEREEDQWDIRIDSRLDATPSQTGWLKFSRIDIETDETTDRGNTKYGTIRGVFTDDRDHTTYVRGEPEPGEPGTKQLLQQIDSPETHFSRSLIDKDALEEYIKEEGLDKEGTYDQIGMTVGILLGGDIEIKEEGPTAIVPEYLVTSEDGREEENIEIVSAFEKDGDIALRDKLREHYFNKGFDQYEGTEYNLTEEGEVEYMEGIDDFDISEQIADA